MNKKSKFVLNVSPEIYAFLIKNGNYGDSMDAILRRLLNFEEKKESKNENKRKYIRNNNSAA